MSEFSYTVLVLGGGAAGLSAALNLHEQGLRVYLVELEDHLGGNALNWACMATDACEHCGACLGAELIDKVTGLEHVSIFLKTRLNSLTKNNGRFEASVTGDKNLTIKADAVVLATGFSPFDPSLLSSLACAESEKIITTAQLNQLIKMEKLHTMLGENASVDIAFIQCIGSRNRKLEKDYCSQVCCKISFRHANKILHLFANANITIYHMDLQIIGKQFRSFAKKLSDRVTLKQGVAAEILQDRVKGKVTIIHEDETKDARQASHYDMAVLSVGLQPSEKTAEISKMAGIAPDGWGFLSGSAQNLPQGVYTAGAVKGPTSIVEAIQSGAIAASRLANDIAASSKSAGKMPVAVFGGGSDAVLVCKELKQAGYPVIALDSGRDAALADSGIDHFKDAQALAVKGVAANYQLDFRTGKQIRSEKVGAIVVATGAAANFEAPEGLDRHAMSLDAFLEMKPERIPSSVVFWLDRHGPEWKDYAGKTLEAAAKMAGEQKRVYVLMEKMLVHGLGRQKDYDAARKKGVKFIRVNEQSGIELAVKGKQVEITAPDELLGGQHLCFTCDLLVIPKRIAPAGETQRLASILQQSVDQEGFFQSANTRHRLIGSPRRGLFFAGACHDEIDGFDLKEEIAAIKAGLDALFLNKTGNGQPPVIGRQTCRQCLTCYRICPHRAIILQETNKPLIVDQACFGCGLCVASCPAKAIGRDEDQDEIITSNENKAHTFVFACQRSGALAVKEAKRLGLELGDTVHIEPVSCAGRVSIETMLKPLFGAAKRVLVAGCHNGNCRSGDSGEHAQKRVRFIKNELALSLSELDFIPVSANEPEKLRKKIP
ncbi:MAG: FAD-dependent oxidoreductase [Desulfobacteraceae bacterium]|nr:FAD-dependent oxidoreductase [Desulfobacteraceae bacterium]